jgi:hypothetical protein
MKNDDASRLHLHVQVIQRSLIKITKRIRATSASSALLVMLLLSNALLYLAGFIYVHYFGFDVATSLTFPGADGWCIAPEESFGNHCFGDYALTIKVAAEANPWATDFGFLWNYPAGAMIPAAIFLTLGKWFGIYKIGLVGYLTVGALALTVPAIWASRGKPSLPRVAVISTLSLTAIPALMALDRGNSVMLAAPIFLVYLVSLSRGKYSQTVIAIALASILKPQFIVLALIFLVIRKFRFFALSVLSSISLNVIAFLAWPSNFPKNIVGAVRNTLSYSEGRSLSDIFPTNVSLVKPLYWLEYAIRGFFGQSKQDSWVDNHQWLATAIVVGAMLACIATAGRFQIVEIQASVILVIASLVVPVSWSYYLVFALPVAAIVIRDPTTPVANLRRGTGILDRSRTRRSWSDLALVASLLLALVSSISRFLLPITDDRAPGLLLGSGEVAAGSWLLFLIVACITKPSSKEKGPSPEVFLTRN